LTFDVDFYIDINIDFDIDININIYFYLRSWLPMLKAETATR
jgi:hypothetical protein